MLRLLMAGVLALVLAACQSSTRPIPLTLVTPSPSYNDPAKPITVRNGDTFTIALPGNSSADFDWQVEAVDESLLSLVAREREPWAGTGQPPAGWAAPIDLTFSAKTPGQTELTLVQRSSNGVVGQRHTFSVTVTPR